MNNITLYGTNHQKLNPLWQQAERYLHFNQKAYKVKAFTEEGANLKEKSIKNNRFLQVLKATSYIFFIAPLAALIVTEVYRKKYGVEAPPKNPSNDPDGGAPAGAEAEAEMNAEGEAGEEESHKPKVRRLAEGGHMTLPARLRPSTRQSGEPSLHHPLREGGRFAVRKRGDDAQSRNDSPPLPYRSPLHSLDSSDEEMPPSPLPRDEDMPPPPPLPRDDLDNSSDSAPLPLNDDTPPPPLPRDEPAVEEKAVEKKRTGRPLPTPPPKKSAQTEPKVRSLDESSDSDVQGADDDEWDAVDKDLAKEDAASLEEFRAEQTEREESRKDEAKERLANRTHEVLLAAAFDHICLIQKITADEWGAKKPKEQRQIIGKAIRATFAINIEMAQKKMEDAFPITGFDRDDSVLDAIFVKAEKRATREYFTEQFGEAADLSEQMAAHQGSIARRVKKRRNGLTYTDRKGTVRVATLRRNGDVKIAESTRQFDLKSFGTIGRGKGKGKGRGKKGTIRS